LSYITNTFAFEKADSESPQPRDVFRTVAFRDSTVILIEIPVKDVVAAVFDAPVLTIVSEDLFGGCQLWSFAGDTACDNS
jgi:hypothetical protein